MGENGRILRMIKFKPQKRHHRPFKNDIKFYLVEYLISVISKKIISSVVFKRSAKGEKLIMFKITKNVFQVEP